MSHWIYFDGDNNFIIPIKTRWYSSKVKMGHNFNLNFTCYYSLNNFMSVIIHENI